MELNLLPVCYDREIKDLTFLYKALYGMTDLNALNYVSFVPHGSFSFFSKHLVRDFSFWVEFVCKLTLVLLLCLI